MAEFTKAIEEKNLGEGAMIPVNLSGKVVCLAKSDGRLFAFADTCTHKQCSLSDGILDDQVVECPCHGARFSIENGEVLALPATLPIEIYPVKVENGWIMVEV